MCHINVFNGWIDSTFYISQGFNNDHHGTISDVCINALAVYLRFWVFIWSHICAKNAEVKHKVRSYRNSEDICNKLDIDATNIILFFFGEVYD